MMAFCPFGNKALQILVPLAKEFEDEIELHLFYIIMKKGKEFEEKEIVYNSSSSESCSGEGKETLDGKYFSLHGDLEVEESKWQLVIKKYEPDFYFDYLEERAMNIDSPRDKIFEELKLDTDYLSSLVQAEGDKILSENINQYQKTGFVKSPTILINGLLYEGRLSKLPLLKKICDAYPLQICDGMSECEDRQDCFQKNKIGFCKEVSEKRKVCQYQDLNEITLVIINSVIWPQQGIWPVN